MNALTMGRSAVPEAETLADVLRLADMLAKSSMVPADYQGKPENVVVAVLWGREVGLGPLQALQNVAVINGRPSLWGDAALALVQVHPACEAIHEGVDGEGDARHGWCEVTRKGRSPERRTFSVADAKRAKLWGKTSRSGNPTPWVTYPDRMLQMRARGFALRDVFPDALRGVITAEEAADIPDEPRFVPSATAAVPAPERPAIDPASLVSASSFGLEALDCALSQLFTAECVRGYLGEPRLQSWLAGLRRNRPEQAVQADTIINATWARVRVESRDEGADEAEPVAVWVIVGSGGKREVYGTRDEWLAAWKAKVEAVEAAPNSVVARRAVLERMLAVNADAFAAIQRNGSGVVVIEATGLVTAADGRLAGGGELAVAAE